MTTTTAPTRRIAYNRLDRDYSCFIIFEDEHEEPIGNASTFHDAELKCDEYLFNFFVDNHTPEKAAAIAVGMSETDQVAPEPTELPHFCFFHPSATDHDTRNCPKVEEDGFGAPSYSVFN